MKTATKKDLENLWFDEIYGEFQKLQSFIEKGYPAALNHPEIGITEAGKLFNLLEFLIKDRRFREALQAESDFYDNLNDLYPAILISNGISRNSLTQFLEAGANTQEDIL